MGFFWGGRDCGFGSKKMFLTPRGGVAVLLDLVNILRIYYILYITYIKAALGAVKIIISSCACKMFCFK